MADIRSSTWSTTASGNDASPPDGWPEGQSPSSVNNCAREMMAAIKRAWNDDHPVNESAGSNSAYTLVTSASSTAYATGDMYVFRANHASVGTSTLNVNGIGARIIKKFGNQDTIADDIKANQVVQVAYEPSADVWQLLTAAFAPNLNDLSDVDLSGGAATGDALIYDGSTWSAATAGAQTIGELSDVSASSPATSDFLSFDGSVWAPVQLDVTSEINTAFNVSGSAPLYACRAWVNFDGTNAFSPNPSTSAIRASGNVSSIADVNTGTYIVSFTTSMPDLNYAVMGMGMLNRRIQYAGQTFDSNSQTISCCAIKNTDSSTGLQDDECINIAVFR